MRGNQSWLNWIVVDGHYIDLILKSPNSYLFFSCIFIILGLSFFLGMITLYSICFWAIWTCVLTVCLVFIVFCFLLCFGRCLNNSNCGDTSNVLRRGGEGGPKIAPLRTWLDPLEKYFCHFTIYRWLKILMLHIVICFDRMTDWASGASMLSSLPNINRRFLLQVSKRCFMRNLWTRQNFCKRRWPRWHFGQVGGSTNIHQMMLTKQLRGSMIFQSYLTNLKRCWVRMTALTTLCCRSN